jgi:hypothetical protein
MAPGSTTWVSQGPYGPGDVLAWNTSALAPGAYQVRVWTLGAGSSPASGYDVSTTVPYTLASSTVALTVNPKSPQTAGSANPTFTATAAGTKASYNYQFLVKAPGGAWTSQGAYGSGNTFTWNTASLPAGTYSICAWAEIAGTTPPAGYDAQATLTYVLDWPAVTLAPGLASPQAPGAAVTFTATPQGAYTAYQYQFFVQAPGGAWKSQGAYGSSNTFAWNTASLAPGAYQVRVWALGAGASPASGFNAAATLAYTLSSSSVALTVNLKSPQAAGKANPTFTATATGTNATYLYQFLVKAPGGAWTSQGAYASGDTFTWNTAGLPKGAYTVQVWTVIAGTHPPGGSDAQATLGYTLD